MDSTKMEQLEPPLFKGNDYDRGRQAAEFYSGARESLIKRVSTAVRLRDQNGESEWLNENCLRLKAIFPQSAEFIRGTADGYGIAFEDLMTSSHVDLLKDRALARRALTEGEAAWTTGIDECSTFAFPAEGCGSVVAKNRDNNPGAASRHTLSLHRDPSWDCKWMLAISSAGGPMVASSGINGHGLVVVCNAARPRHVEQGFHKAFLMDAILSSCDSVEMALAMLRAVRHAGEGNLVLGDSHGAVAAVGFPGSTADIVSGNGREAVFRTNHFCGDQFKPLNQRQTNDPAKSLNSYGRFDFLESLFSQLTIPWQEGWEAAADWAMNTLSHQDNDGKTSLSFDNEHKYTSSGVIFRTNPPALFMSDGPPSRGIWRRWDGPDQPAA